jgi:hypothetical protein
MTTLAILLAVLAILAPIVIAFWLRSKRARACLTPQDAPVSAVVAPEPTISAPRACIQRRVGWHRSYTVED